MNNKIVRELLDYLKVIVITVIVTYSALYFVQISRVMGQSMEPNYHQGNIVLVNKKFYHYDDVKYSDVVVVEANFDGEEEQIIKRVIGKGGDTIECKNHEMYRNGKKINEDYINEEMMDEDWTYTVSEEHVFVMGDNRNHSSDSRVIGDVDFDEDVVGKVFVKLF